MTYTTEGKSTTCDLKYAQPQGIDSAGSRLLVNEQLVPFQLALQWKEYQGHPLSEACKNETWTDSRLLILSGKDAYSPRAL